MAAEHETRLSNTSPDTAVHAVSADAVDLALARLDASRERLRGVIAPRATSSRASRRANGAGTAQAFMGVPDAIKGMAQAAGLGSALPWIDDALGTARSWVARWWNDHPWREAGEAVAAEAQHALTPTIRRHPLGSAAVAFGIGAAIAIARPWRHPLVLAGMGSLPKSARRWFWQQARHASVQQAFAGSFAAVLAQMRARDRAAAQASDDGLAPTTRTAV